MLIYPTPPHPHPLARAIPFVEQQQVLFLPLLKLLPFINTPPPVRARTGVVIERRPKWPAINNISHSLARSGGGGGSSKRGATPKRHNRLTAIERVQWAVLATTQLSAP